MSAWKMSRSVFVTVGTTRFDDLIKTTSSSQLCEIFKALGYSKLVLQTGTIDFDVQHRDIEGFKVDHFDYKSSIEADIRDASLVISHAGAGSVLDVLGQEKPLLVVINQELQGNHQTELAQQLASAQYLYYCSCRTLAETLQNSDFSKLQPFPAGQPERFAMFLDRVMGF